jgi:hypothetical protein
VLRVHQFGLPRVEAEEGRGEHLYLVERAGGADVVRVGEGREIYPGGRQLLLREERDGLDAVTQVPPELLDVLRAGEAARHADDGDVLRPHVLR